MDRRTLLKAFAGAGTLAASGQLSAPALAQGAAARTLRFVPQANLANFDPIWGTQYVVRNASAMVWDTLYGVDEKLQPQRQMVEAEEVSSDGLTWTFRLRPGLKFHDGEPVLAKDVAASLDRWAARDQMGLLIRGLQQELVPVDDRKVKSVLKEPFPKMLLALSNIGAFRMNHLYPPFNDVRARRAVLMAMSQEDYMRAIVGDDDKLWKPLPGFFTPGTPLYTEEGGEILKGPRDLDGAKKLLAQSRYAGEPVTCLVAQDQPITKAQGDITADLLKRLGMNVDFAAIDWGTVGARRAVKTPPGQGGWQMFHTWHSGADCVNPAVAIGVRASGEKAWFGWPDAPEVEAQVSAWY